MWRASILAIFVLVAGILLALGRESLHLEDATTFIALLLTPLIVLAIASGKIQEFSAPGGWKAKFFQVARAGVESTSLQAQAAGFTENAPDATQVREEAVKHLVKGECIYLALEPSEGFYTPELTTSIIETLLSLDHDLPIVILRKEDQTFFAVADAGRFLALLEDKTPVETTPRGKFLIDKIEANDLRALQSGIFPELVYETLDEKTSNAEALQKMLKLNLRAMIIVGSDNKPMRIVKRDLIVAQLVEQLATSN